MSSACVRFLSYFPDYRYVDLLEVTDTETSIDREEWSKQSAAVLLPCGHVYTENEKDQLISSRAKRQAESRAKIEEQEKGGLEYPYERL